MFLATVQLGMEDRRGGTGNIISSHKYNVYTSGKD